MVSTAKYQQVDLSWPRAFFCPWVPLAPIRAHAHGTASGGTERDHHNLRPRKVHLLIFWCMLFGTPQTSKPTMAPPNPTTIASYGTIWCNRSVSWGCHWPYHGGRGQSRCGAGWQWLMLVVVCFCVVVVIRLLATNDTYFVESWYWIGQNGWFFCTHNKKCIKQHPNYKTASK